MCEIEVNSIIMHFEITTELLVIDSCADVCLVYNRNRGRNWHSAELLGKGIKTSFCAGIRCSPILTLASLNKHSHDIKEDFWNAVSLLESTEFHFMYNWHTIHEAVYSLIDAGPKCEVIPK